MTNITSFSKKNSTWKTNLPREIKGFSDYSEKLMISPKKQRRRGRELKIQPARISMTWFFIVL
jgi:hypothetical protein